MFLLDHLQDPISPEDFKKGEESERQEMKVKELRKLAVDRRSHNHWILNYEKEEYKKQYKLQREVLKQMRKEKKEAKRNKKNEEYSRFPRKSRNAPFHWYGDLPEAVEDNGRSL
ncbi:hypothetical protein CAEBREN_24013 [Caenorhabditis brenneri]|uniref:Uncharacterized protein n=1 Tax=Caenorhabditis brenneri TaxID=135651 RepID=G0PJY9_CAEBE|nr:hypothetical protein CAEBREN_24013 [Caenorhabditis brenneri]